MEQPIYLQLEGQVLSFDKPSLIIGRANDSDITLSSSFVSWHHARIFWEGGVPQLEDLGSRNGTFLNGHEVKTPQRLSEGDKIRIANETFTFVQSDAARTTTELPGRWGLLIDVMMREVTVNGNRVEKLSVSQFQVLSFLYKNVNKPCSKEDIISAVWQDQMAEGVSDAALDSLIHRLRRELALYDPDHQYIVTIRNFGYKFMQKMR